MLHNPAVRPAAAADASAPSVGCTAGAAREVAAAVEMGTPEPDFARRRAAAGVAKAHLGWEAKRCTADSPVVNLRTK